MDTHTHHRTSICCLWLISWSFSVAHKFEYVGRPLPPLQFFANFLFSARLFSHQSAQRTTGHNWLILLLFVVVVVIVVCASQTQRAILPAPPFRETRSPHSNPVSHWFANSWRIVYFISNIINFILFFSSVYSSSRTGHSHRDSPMANSCANDELLLESRH